MKRYLPLLREKSKKEKMWQNYIRVEYVDKGVFIFKTSFLLGKAMNSIRRNDLRIYYLESDDVYDSYE